MLDIKKINRIVTAAARKTLGKEFVRAESEPTLDSRGEGALKVVIVVKPGAADRITGAAALGTLAEIQDRLEEAGEDRVAIVEYATEEELAEIDES